MTNEELEQKLKRLEEQLTEVRIALLENKADKKLYEVEYPENLEDYYIVDIDAEVELLAIYSENLQRIAFIRGLAFKTKEEVEQHDKERILLFKLHKWAEKHNGNWKPKWEGNGVKWYVMYETDRDILKTNWCICCRQFTKLPYFKSEEIAKQFIKEFGEEIKEVLL